MAKEIDKIIQSKTAPKSNNVLWDDGENLKINRNGKWETTTSNSDNITEELKDAGIEYYEIIINIPDDLKINDYNTYESLGEAGQTLKEYFKKANKCLHVTVKHNVNCYYPASCLRTTFEEAEPPLVISWMQIDPRTTFLYYINEITDNQFYFGIKSIMTE
jgi:hypothetical protein